MNTVAQCGLEGKAKLRHEDRKVYNKKSNFPMLLINWLEGDFKRAMYIDNLPILMTLGGIHLKEQSLHGY
jgi:hypothetical protein